MTAAYFRFSHETIDALDLRFAELRLACPEAIARIREEMEREGLRHPLLVSDGVEEKKLVVVDGFKRLRVACGLGHIRVATRVVHLAAVPAQVEILRANGPRRGVSDVEEALVVQRLHRQHGMSQNDNVVRVSHANDGSVPGEPAAYETRQSWFDPRTGAALGDGLVTTKRPFDRAGRVGRVAPLV